MPRPISLLLAASLLSVAPTTGYAQPLIAGNTTGLTVMKLDSAVLSEDFQAPFIGSIFIDLDQDDQQELIVTIRTYWQSHFFVKRISIGTDDPGVQTCRYNTEECILLSQLGDTITCTDSWDWHGDDHALVLETGSPSSNCYVGFQGEQFVPLRWITAQDTLTGWLRFLLYDNGNDVTLLDIAFPSFPGIPRVTIKSQDGLKIWPNPTEGNVVIRPEKDFAGGMVRVYDVQGRLMFEEDMPGGVMKVLNLARLPRGLYLIHASGAGRAFSGKVIKR